MSKDQVAGIYFHIPFCRKACTYCDFHFSTNLNRLEDMVQAMHSELRERADFLKGDPLIATIYFGGGTPSVLSLENVRTLLNAVRKKFRVAEDPEITLECNPDDLDPEYLEGLRALGLNRLSIGVQSFREKDLEWMNRSHDAQQARKSIILAKEKGFENLTVDLIYGIPGLTDAEWEANVRQLLEMEVPHISAYALTVEERTVLAKRVQDEVVAMPEDEAYARQFGILIDMLEAAGYEHYELSNFALPGFRSVHNSSYWEGVPYLGIGPSAHSYDGQKRSWNISNNARYLKAIAAGERTIESEEELTDNDRLNEYLMTHFRKAEGISLEEIKKRWGFDLEEKEGEKLRKFMAAGWMERKNSRLFLTRAGKLVSDHIISELFQL